MILLETICHYLSWNFKKKQSFLHPDKNWQIQANHWNGLINPSIISAVKKCELSACMPEGVWNTNWLD